MYQIETHIPLPTKRVRTGVATVYPLADMHVEDSFLIPLQPVTLADRRRVSAAVASFARRHKADGVSFAVRTVSDGLRVWRIA